MAQDEAEIMVVGVLRTEENAHLWNNGEKTISIQRRVNDGEVTQVELDEAESRLNGSYVPVTKGAARRCIDGSTIEGYDDSNPKWYGRALGPQIQGGTVDEAFAMRLNRGFNTEPDATLLGDMEIVVRENNSGFAPGDHTDDHNDGNPDNTGCGAANGIAQKSEMINKDETADFVQQTADTIVGLVGQEPQPGKFASIQARAAELRQRPNYLPPHIGDTLAKIRELNPGGIEKLVRPHNEAFLTINFVAGTTFHRDHFNAASYSKIQNFNLDAWAIVEEYGEDGYALVVDAVLTFLSLTDGSQKVLIRQPKSRDEFAEVA